MIYFLSRSHHVVEPERVEGCAWGRVGKNRETSDITPTPSAARTSLPFRMTVPLILMHFRSHPSLSERKDVEMQRLVSWRQLLSEIIRDPTERHRIATEARVQEITLRRWASGLSMPRTYNLRLLIAAFPQQYRDRFLALLEQEISLVLLEEEEQEATEISSLFFDEVLLTRATSPDPSRLWAISHQVLQHALEHLDAQRKGLALSVVCAVPPRAGRKVQSLYLSMGVGTQPWQSRLEPDMSFFGAESLVGHVLSTGHFEQIPDVRTTTWFAGDLPEHEISIAASPILYATRIAGCLLAQSTRQGMFLPQESQLLLERYARLLALAFEPHEFFALDQIALGIMPLLKMQRPFLLSFRERVVRLMQEAAESGHPLTSPQAECLVRQEVEEVLLHRLPRSV